MSRKSYQFDKSGMQAPSRKPDKEDESRLVQTKNKSDSKTYLIKKWVVNSLVSPLFKTPKSKIKW
jgi:hypothetical protein